MSLDIASLARTRTTSCSSLSSSCNDSHAVRSLRLTQASLQMHIFVYGELER
ncbi:MAG: hypothetical protein RMY34_08365 [Aulosira sp. DedQUE10]|nr:hypothetical protein [Aulosira sp. DedQUE10]